MPIDLCPNPSPCNIKLRRFFFFLLFSATSYELLTWAAATSASRSSSSKGSMAAMKSSHDRLPGAAPLADTAACHAAHILSVMSPPLVHNSGTITYYFKSISAPPSKILKLRLNGP